MQPGFLSTPSWQSYWKRIIRVPTWSMPALSVPIVWLSPSVIPIRNGLLLPTIWPILCGSELILQDELYKSESATNFNNRSIAWLLKKNYNRIYDDPDMSLDLYTRHCSMGVTTKQLAIAGCTIANKGKNR